jgi:hypothetical protein
MSVPMRCFHSRRYCPVEKYPSCCGTVRELYRVDERPGPPLTPPHQHEFTPWVYTVPDRYIIYITPTHLLSPVFSTSHPQLFRYIAPFLLHIPSCLSFYSEPVASDKLPFITSLNPTISTIAFLETQKTFTLHLTRSQLTGRSINITVLCKTK